jgi:hypothetical protein
MSRGALANALQGKMMNWVQTERSDSSGARGRALLDLFLEGALLR